MLLGVAETGRGAARRLGSSALRVETRELPADKARGARLASPVGAGINVTIVQVMVIAAADIDSARSEVRQLMAIPSSPKKRPTPLPTISMVRVLR
jgi:hypothetical protein